MSMYFVAPGEFISWIGAVAANSTGSGSGGEDVFSFVVPRLIAFLRRCRQKRISERMAMRAARPPTTPPAIAPTLVLLRFAVPVEVAVLEGMIRVAARVENVGTRVK